MSMIEAEKEARNEKLLKFAGLCPHKWVHFWEIDFKSPEYLYLGGHKGYSYRCVSCGASSMDDTEGLYDFLDEEWGIALCFKWLVPNIPDLISIECQPLVHPALEPGGYWWTIHTGTTPYRWLDDKFGGPTLAEAIGQMIDRKMKDE